MILLYQTLRDLWRLLDSRGKWIAGLLVILLVVSGAFEMGGVLFLFGYIAALSGVEVPGNPVVSFFENLGSGLGDTAFAAVTGLVLILVFAVKNATSLLTSFFLMRFAMKRYNRISAQLFEGFLHTRFELFSRRGLLAPQQILDSVSNVFRTSFTAALEAISDIAILATMLVALMLLVDPWMVLVAAALLGSGGGVFLGLTRRMSTELGRRRISAEHVMRQTMLDGFRGLIDIRLGGRQQTIIDRYRRIAGEFALMDRRTRALELAPRALNEIVLTCGIVVAAIYFATTPGGMQGALPSLAVMGFAGLRMTSAMARLASALQRMREDESKRHRMMEAIGETAPAAILSGKAVRARDDYLVDDTPLPEGRSGRLADRITLRDVGFTYPDAAEPALRGISLEIPRGSFTGICGPSGGGKSTLALAIMGLIHPQQGEILCDGWDVFRHLRAWHASIGFVPQAPFISPRSVRENVAFGYEPEEIDDDRVWRALEMAALADTIRTRPNGLNSNLGEEGMLVSGGQRQRLNIARALYRDPDVLVFDEATAALDSQTEREVTEAIRRLSGEKTVICIAHRISTIREADSIFVIESGRVAANGKYAELNADSEAFRQLSGEHDAKTSRL